MLMRMWIKELHEPQGWGIRLCCEDPKSLSPGLSFSPRNTNTGKDERPEYRGQDDSDPTAISRLAITWESGTNSSREAIPRDSVSSEPGKPVSLGRPIKLFLSSSSLDSSFCWLTFLKIQLLPALIVTKLIDFFNIFLSWHIILHVHRSIWG